MFNSIAKLISLIYIKSNVVISSIKQGVLTGERVYKMNFNKLFASILLLAVSISPTFAAFPEKDIKVIIGVSPGGGFDTYMRALIPILERYLGNDVNVLPINSAGSGGRRGALETFKAKPDGYTIGMFNMPGVLIPQLTENDVGYDLEKITWLATLGNDPYAFIVNKDSDLISFDQVLAQKSPILFGATGPSSTSYVATVIMNETLGIPYEVVTGYTGSSEYAMGVMRGDVVAALLSMATARAYIKSGDVRALAMIGMKSPDPKIADADSLGKPDLGKLNVVRMIGAPPGLPADIKAIYEKAFMAAMADPEFTKWLESTGNDAAPAGADATSATVTGLIEFYKKYINVLKK